MIGRLISYTLFFLIVTGLVIHFQIEVPGFSTWIGHLPGDLILRKGGTTIFLPFTTSFLLSVVLTIISSVFSRS